MDTEPLAFFILAPLALSLWDIRCLFIPEKRKKHGILLAVGVLFIGIFVIDSLGSDYIFQSFLIACVFYLPLYLFTSAILYLLGFDKIDLT